MGDTGAKTQRVLFGAGLAALIVACDGGGGGDTARIRIEGNLQAGIDFDRVTLALRAAGDERDFYSATWEVGSAALPQLPATLVVRRGAVDRIEVTGEALLKAFVVDRQVATLDFSDARGREARLLFGPHYACGNGRRDEGESCDCGSESTQSSECRTPNSDVAPDACRTNCTRARCGDGVIDTGEECDDNNTVDTDSCRANCTVNRCGDGVPRHGALCFAEAKGSPFAGAFEGIWVTGINIAAVDLNSDGADDLLSCCSKLQFGPFPSYGFSVRLSNGDGSFAAPIVHQGAYGPLAVGHFGDAAHVNLVTVDFGGNGPLRLWEGDGAGHFVSRIAIATPSPSAPNSPSRMWRAVIAADVNGDGLSDVVASDDAQVAIFRSDGRGGMLAGESIAAPRVYQISAGDISGDGLDDLVWVWAEGAKTNTTISISRSAPGVVTLKGPTTSLSDVRVSLVDVDGDGHLELIATGKRPFHGTVSGDVEVFHLDAAGAFTPGTAPPHDFLPPSCAASFGDLDGNGMGDLVLDSLSIFLGLKTIGLDTAQVVPFQHLALPACGSVALGDFDGDGWRDIATAACAQNQLFCPNELVVMLNRP